MHAVIAFSSVPLFLGALLSDSAYFSTHQIQWVNFAAWLIVGGLPRATAAAVTVARLPSAINHHWTKSLAADADDRYLYVGIGSNSNIGDRGMAVEERLRRPGRVDATSHDATTVKTIAGHCRIANTSSIRTLPKLLGRKVQPRTK